jgi:predicted nucleic acid-binding protein
VGRRLRQATFPFPFPTPLFVLDAEPFSLLGEDDPRIVARIAVAREKGFVPAISAVTLAEVRRGGAVGKRLMWQRTHLTVLPVSEKVADLAGRLLEGAGLDGHECVVDALVVAAAAAGGGPAKVVSSDASHVPRLVAEAGVHRDPPIGWLRV